MSLPSPHPSLRHSLSWVTPYFSRRWKLLCVLAGFLVLTIGFQLGTPQLLRAFLDAVTSQAEIRTIFSVIIAYIVVAFGLRGARVGEEYFAELVAWEATNALRVDLVRHCLSLDLSFHISTTPGELIELIDGDVSVLRHFFSRFVLVLITNTVIVIGIIILLGVIDWRMGVLLLGYGVVYVATIFWLNRATVVPFIRGREADATLFGFLEERLSGTEEIRAAGAGGSVLRQFADLARRRLRTNQHAEVVQGWISLLRMCMYVVGLLTSLIFAALLYQQGRITIGTAYLMFAYMSFVWQPLRDLVYQFNDFQRALASLHRLGGVFGIQPSIADGHVDVLPAEPLGVRFAHVTFAYAGATPALQDISFDLAPGRTLGIVGHTGSGKSTLTRLLFRLYDPQHGAIFLNDTDIATLTIETLRSRIGLVTQDVQLFHAPVRDNVTLFDRTIPDAAILDAFAVLGLSDWYAQLPNGLETALDDDTLSAGQAQLIALTRAFLQQPDLVILDEASSRLDPQTDMLLSNAMHTLLEGRTALIIAHRLQTLNAVDDVLVLENGHVREYGPRATLAATKTSLFARLLETDHTARTQAEP